MEDRVWFAEGEQRKFMDLVVENLSCGSVRGILQFGLDVSYDALKSYYTERRVLPKGLFENLCYISKIETKHVDCHVLDGRYCYMIGGFKSKRVKNKNKN